MCCTCKKEISTIKAGEKVECYFNKRKGKVSVRSVDIENPQHNRIVAHSDYIHLENVELRMRSGRKVVRGNYVCNYPILPNSKQTLHCKDDKFFTTNGEEINSAKYAVCFNDSIVIEP